MIVYYFNIYKNDNKLDKSVIPHIDLDLYNHLFGDYKKNHNIVSGKDKFFILNILINLKKNSKLKY